MKLSISLLMDVESHITNTHTQFQTMCVHYLLMLTLHYFDI